MDIKQLYKVAVQVLGEQTVLITLLQQRIAELEAKPDASVVAAKEKE